MVDRYRRAAMTRAINRFQNAVEEFAFIGTIPFDSEAALERRREIEEEFLRSREGLEAFIIRHSS